MKLQQLSIFLENREGRLAEVTRILADAQIDIKALSLADTSDFGILRMIVSETDKAALALSEHQITVRKTDVVAVEIIDRVGGLSNVLSLLDGAKINVEYMYAFPDRHNPNAAIMVFRFEDPERAIQALEDARIRVVTSEDLAL